MCSSDLQPNFELTVKPWIDLETGMTIAFGAELLRFDTYPRFEITKSSVSRSLASGLEPEMLADQIRRLAGDMMPQNIAFSIRDWAREYRAVQVYEGTVLAVDEALRHLVEHSDAVQSFVHRTLAPGVYLVREGFEEALQTAGIDVVPQVQRVEQSRRSPHRLPRGLRNFRPERLAITIETSEPPVLDGRQDNADLKEQIDSSTLSSDLKDDLRQRMRRKLIVHPDQISSAGGRREKVEARGLDYLGKVKLIQQTVSSKTHHLEVVARDRKGAPLRYLIRPEHVDKSGKSSF